MTVYDLLGMLELRIDSLEPERVLREITSLKKILYIRTQGESVILGLPFGKKNAALSICQENGWSAEITRERGLLTKLRGYLKRYGIAAGVLISAILCLYMSNIAMKIRIVGAPSPQEEEQIRQILSNNGLHAGAYIPGLNLIKLETELLKASGSVAWASIGSTGSVVSVSVSMSDEKAQTRERRIPCNIVSDKDGQILKASVLVGELSALIGSPVKKGELLVSGIIENPNGQAYYVHAIADIIAEYTESVTLEQPLYDSIDAVKDPVYKRYLSFFEYNIPLPGERIESGSSAIDSYSQPIRLFGIPLPIGIMTEKYVRVESSSISYSIEEAAKVLEDKLYNYETNMLKDAEILEKKESYELRGGSLYLTVSYRLRGNIGRESPLFVKRKISDSLPESQ